ncbi:CLUMA_CG021563, isoform A [Clunio marinus]|uniref:CLUMA_CG021563, isoform A n=1 Tax=Clunio marinus TaxID=568069 RepID=A0A1J1J7W0_9DIPT|nr:CLUMA_CG021563, isoform A [Clunio marinus]
MKLIEDCLSVLWLKVYMEIDMKLYKEIFIKRSLLFLESLYLPASTLRLRSELKQKKILSQFCVVAVSSLTAPNKRAINNIPGRSNNAMPQNASALNKLCHPTTSDYHQLFVHSKCDAMMRYFSTTAATAAAASCVVICIKA